MVLMNVQHLFHDGGYNKPLFWTYFKTTLFSIYLSAFLFWRPWQRMCGWRRGEGRITGRRRHTAIVDTTVNKVGTYMEHHRA